MANRRGRSGISDWFCFLGSKITVSADCSHEIQRCLLLGRKAMTNPDSVLKSRDITLLPKVLIVKAVVFPVVMYSCESYTIKKADAFELWFWRRLLRVSWAARRSNQSILKEINPDYSLKGLMLKLQYFGYLMWTATDSLGRTPILGKTEGKRRRGWQSMRWLDNITESIDMNLNKFRETEGRGAWSAVVHGVPKSWTWLRDWTTKTDRTGIAIKFQN